MANRASFNNHGLLPHYFKIVGLFLSVGLLVMAILFKIFNSSFLQSNKAILRPVLMNALIVGIFLIAWSKDKFEDELTILIRFKTLGFAFCWGVLYLVMSPLIDHFLPSFGLDLNAQGLILSMLFVYLALFYMQKISFK